MKKCGYRAEQIEEYVRGELGEDERAELERDLAECEDCRREAEFLKTVSELTEENMAEPPKELREGVMAAVKREKRRRRFIPRAAAGVLAASLAVAVGLRWLPNGSTESSGAQPGVYVMSAGSAQDSPSGVYSIEVPEPAAADTSRLRPLASMIYCCLSVKEILMAILSRGVTAAVRTSHRASAPSPHPRSF